MNTVKYTAINAKAIDTWIDGGGIGWAIPISHEVYIAATNGDWTIDGLPRDWLPPVKGKTLLGLASGGGQQMPIFVALGAECTLVDYSDRQLDSDRLVSERENYLIDLIKADITEQFPFNDEQFDVIFHPVSNNYIEDVQHIWSECFRVLKSGGLLIAQMSNGLDFLFDDDSEPLIVRNKLPWNPLKMPPERLHEMIDNVEGLEFSHSLEDNIGGMCRAGFLVTGLVEMRDPPGQGVVRDYMPQYYSVRAKKL
ncbi:methyltransferase [Clostridia bacterium]|nr:methyltransferase [Clostridia bacterium]